MKELEGTALQEYIRNAITAETDVATQNEIISNYTATANAKKPQCILQQEPLKPEYYQDDRGGIEFGVGAVLLCSGISLLWMMSGYDDMLVGLIRLFCWGFIGYGVYSLIKGHGKKTAYDENKKNYTYEMEKFRTQCAKVNEKNKQTQQKYSQDIIIWRETNDEMYAFMAEPLAKTKQVLETYYSQDVIYPKYRNLPALTSIYEYLITGRCEGLTGPHGAYNLYEDEVRKDMVISQLSVVIQNLEQIKQNQYMLYQQVKEIQQTTNSIENELRQIKGYSVQIASLTALNAYYSALNERNTRITMWCNI